MYISNISLCSLHESVSSLTHIHIYLLQTYLSAEGLPWYTHVTVPIKGVFKGGVQGVQTPPPPKFSDFFLKSEGKETERKKGCWGGGGGLLLHIFLGVDIEWG